MNISVVISAYNEEKTIKNVIIGVRAQGYKTIIVVDDGSADATSLIAKKEGAIVLKHAINLGPGAAFQTGIEAALFLGADIIVTVDADLQHDPRDIKYLIEPIAMNRADVSIGNRFLKKNSIPFLRKIFNFVGNIITFAISWIWVSDTQSGFKAFSRKAGGLFSIDTNGYEFCSEIIRKIAEKKLRYVQVPIHVYYSQLSLAKGQNFANGVKTALKLVIKSLFS